MTPLPSSFVWAVILTALSGVPGLFFSRTSMAGQYLSVLMTILGTTLGLLSLGLYFLNGAGIDAVGSSSGGALFFWDPLSCFFLAGVFLIAGLGSIYGLGYWKQTDHPDNGRKLRLWYGFMAAGMALVIVARHAFLFLVGWESMAVSAYFLICTEDDQKEVREAGWVYFVATHVSTLLLFAFFAYYGRLKGDFNLSPFHAGDLTNIQADTLFILALVGFGLKAGLFPLHVWLPSAHGNAPSHVSALMSGVLLKVGIYGLMRMCWLFPFSPSWWGEMVVALGIVSAVLGVVFALGQHDLKRLLAYHSIENIGIILLGFGLALWGRAEGKPEWIVLGLAGSLLHVWNHGLFKASLFYAAGSVIHSTKTRRIDALGGLAKQMPWTALGFLVGAVAICGLPPLNGFISEFLVYLGFFKQVGVSEGLSFGLLAVPALALTGGLALACFAKVYGVIFLGEPRTEAAQNARESNQAMLFPLYVLSAICLWIGLVPQSVMPILQKAVNEWAPGTSFQATVGWGSIPWGYFTVGGLLILAGLGLGLWWLGRGKKENDAQKPLPTWDCGFIQASPSIQYTAASFAQILVDLFRWILCPTRKRVEKKDLFPAGESFKTHVPETVLDYLVLPFLKGGQWILKWFKVLQSGYLQAYVLFILAALVALILWK